MENSILLSTKSILGLSEDYTAFDLDVITHINASLATLNQLGIGPVDGFVIEDANEQWSELELPMRLLSLTRTYIFLKVRLLFDPPSTSYLIEATERQITQYEWRLSVLRDELLDAEAEVV